MVALTTYAVLPGLERAKPNDIARSESARHRSSESSLPEGGDARVDMSAQLEPDTLVQSSLPQVTLEDVLDQQGVLIITSEGSGSENSAVVVAVEATESSSGEIEVALVSGSDMEALYTQATLIGASSSQTTSSNVLLLKNGWAYLTLTGSPLELPSEPLMDSINQHWSPWRQGDDGMHEIQDQVSGLWSRLVGTRVDISPKSHEDTSGAYRTTHVSNTLVNTSTSWHDLELSPEGLFSVSSSTLVSGGGLDPDNSFILQVSNSITQRSSTFSGVVRSDGAGSTTVSNQREQLTEHVGDLFGSWEILEDGVTLELSFADGRVERRLFLKSESGEELSMDGDTWWRNSEAAPDLLGRIMRLLADPDSGKDRESWSSILAKVELQTNRRREAPVSNSGNQFSIESVPGQSK